MQHRGRKDQSLGFLVGGLSDRRNIAERRLKHVNKCPSVKIDDWYSPFA